MQRKTFSYISLQINLIVVSSVSLIPLSPYKKNSNTLQNAVNIRTFIGITFRKRNYIHFKP